MAVTVPGLMAAAAFIIFAAAWAALTRAWWQDKPW